jgi:hypothetical protein
MVEVARRFLQSGYMGMRTLVRLPIVEIEIDMLALPTTTAMLAYLSQSKLEA